MEGQSAKEVEDQKIYEDEEKIKSLVGQDGWFVLIRWLKDALKTERGALEDAIIKITREDTPKLRAEIVDRRMYIKYLEAIGTTPEFILMIAKQTRNIAEAKKAEANLEGEGPPTQ